LLASNPDDNGGTKHPSLFISTHRSPTSALVRSPEVKRKAQLVLSPISHGMFNFSSSRTPKDEDKHISRESSGSTDCSMESLRSSLLEIHLPDISPRSSLVERPRSLRLSIDLTGMPPSNAI